MMVTANKHDVAENGALLVGLSRYNDFVAQLYAMHHTQGYTVFLPLAWRAVMQFSLSGVITQNIITSSTKV